MKSLFSAVLTLMISSLFLVGCQNTVKGFGDDMQKNGQEIKKSVND